MPQETRESGQGARTAARRTMGRAPGLTEAPPPANALAIELLRSWAKQDRNRTDKEQLRRSWDALRDALNANRDSNRPCFSEE